MINKEAIKRLENAERLARSVPPPEQPLERKSYFTGLTSRFSDYQMKNRCRD
jgi:hypothetical protein